VADAEAGSPDDDAGNPPPPPACTVSPITDFCAELPQLADTPTIDGELECGVALQPFVPVGWTVAPAIPADHSAQIAAAWRPAGLYLYLDVNDSSRLPAVPTDSSWCGDGVEIYADADATYAAAPAYDSPGTAQMLARAPADDTTVETGTGERYRTQGLIGVWTSTRYAAFPKPGGYVFEAFIDAADLDLPAWSLSAGNAIGFNVSINVSSTAEPAPAGESNDCGRRMGQYFLHIGSPPCSGAQCYPFLNVEAFCAPVLRP
jgi:hypothetical protein